MIIKLIWWIIVLISILFLVLTPNIAFADWPMSRYDFNHQGAVPYSIVETPQEKWLSANLGHIWNPPAVDTNGNIYISATNGGLVVIDKNGQKKWSSNTYNPKSTPIIDGNNIYYAAGGYPSHIYSFDQNGNKKWEYSLGGWGGNNVPTGAAISRDKKTIYTGFGYPTQSLVALDSDGSLKWKTNLQGNTPTSDPVVAEDGTIYIGMGSTGAIAALSDNGVIKWYRYTGTYDIGSITLDSDQNLYLLSSAGNTGLLISYDPLGNKRWQYQYSSIFYYTPPALKNNAIYAVSQNKLLTINTAGNFLWEWVAPPQASRSLTSPIVDKNGVIYTSIGNKLYAVSPSGSQKWELTLSDNLGSPIIPEDNLIYIYHNQGWDGYLHALGKTTPDRIPLIFIPGVGGSEFKTTEDTLWAQPDGHNGTYNHFYPAGEKVWVNELEAAAAGDDDYFDVLRLKADGQTPEANLELTGSLFSGAYQPAIDFFTANGYKLNEDLFIFPYDWRRDLTLTTPLLDQKIEAIKQQTGSLKVDLVAHSMGGLVSRNYINDSQRAQKVRKLVNLGTPHLGSVKFLEAMRSGTCLIYEYGPFCLSVAPSEIKDVIQNMTGAFELAPSQKYFDFYSGENNLHPFPFSDDRDIDSNGVSGPLNYSQTKALLTKLGHNTSLFTPSETFHNLDNNLSNTNGVDVSIIAGSGFDTLGQIIERYLVNFAGIKIPYKDMININGDDTVPLLSASLVDSHKNLSLAGPAKIFYTQQRHGELVSNGPAMNLVKNILDDNSQLPFGVSTIPYKLTGHGLSVHSPVNLHVYDQQGNHTGPLKNGDFEVNIPGSSYDTLDDAKFIFLPDDGIYTVKFEATDRGSFDFKIRNYEDDANQQTILYKNIPIMTNTKAETTFDPGSAQTPVLQVDQDGDGTTDIQVNPTSVLGGNANYDQTAPQTKIKLIGVVGQDNWYKSNVTVELSAQDEVSGSGINKIEYSLDNGQTIQTYTNPIAISSEGSNKLRFRSIDQAGNEENPQDVEIKIDQTPPKITLTANPNQLWPVNKKLIDVKVSGSITDNLSGVASKTFFISDEYQELNPILTDFNQIIKLEAWRNGQDKDGRVYEIRVIGEDLAGNQATAATQILVPHDLKR